jgi:hypothetical protein
MSRIRIKRGNRCKFGCVIQNNVRIRLIEPRLSNLLGPDARGSNVCDGAAFELDPRVGCIDLIGDYWDAEPRE